MRVKTQERNRWWQRTPAIRKMFYTALFAGYTLCIFTLGVYLLHEGYIGRWAATARLFFNSETRNHLAEGLLADPDRIQIDIKFKNYQKLAHLREEAINSGILFSGDDDYVKASIQHNGETIPVKMRLKGDWIDHLRGDKWSFRILTRGDHTLFGMKQLSIHHPKTRKYLMEWVYHQALRREDILGLRYDFISVVLNGKDLGVYALEEHFDKRLVENQNRREGPIIRFNEGRFWDENLQRRAIKGALPNGTGNYPASEIDSFQTSKWLADPATREIHNRAISLLESFRRGKLKTSEAFDVKKLARFFAITDLMGAEHSSRWHNARFYFNPISARLEPIGFDASCGERITRLTLTRNLRGTSVSYYQTVFSDPVFVEQYLIELDRVSQPEYLDKLFEDLADEMQRSLRIIYSEEPNYSFSPEVLYRNQRFIRGFLEPVEALLAYFHRGQDGELELRVGNLHQIDLEIVGVDIEDASCQIIQDDVQVPAREDPPYGLIKFQPLRVNLPEGVAYSSELIPKLRVRYQLLGSAEQRATSVMPWPYIDDALEAADLTRAKANTDEFPFLVVDEEEKTIRLKPGTWTIDKDLIIPRGYRWVCAGNVELQLSAAATILSHSPLEFVGSEDAPIRIVSLSGDSQGVVVLAEEQQSILKFVNFENLSNPARPGWSLTGAVTFYESPVEILHCRFEGNRCEDGLNLVRSKFEIWNCVFARTQGDAFDADFCTGTLGKTEFFDCGNDGMDVSGSFVTLEQVHVKGAGDKAVSVGENSTMTATNLSIQNVNLAVAVKDRSTLTAVGVKISGATIGVALYEKKSEFGAASADLSQLKMETIETPYMVERGSDLVVDGVQIEADREGLKDVLY